MKNPGVVPGSGNRPWSLYTGHETKLMQVANHCNEVLPAAREEKTRAFAVFWLSHRTDVDSMEVMRVFCRLRGQNPLVGLIGMAKAHNVGIRPLHDPQEALFIPVFKKVLVDFTGRAVHQQQIELVAVQLELHPDMGRKGTEVLAFIRLYQESV